MTLPGAYVTLLKKRQRVRIELNQPTTAVLVTNLTGDLRPLDAHPYQDSAQTLSGKLQGYFCPLLYYL